MKTDSYAFVQMADEEGFGKITKDAVRLFGIQMQVSSPFLYVLQLCFFLLLQLKTFSLLLT